MARSGLAALALVAAWATGADTPHGQVTVRFTNATSHDVYLEATIGDGVVWPHATLTSLSLCGQGCDCQAFAPPVPRVRVVPAGETIEAAWDGRYFEGHGCSDRPECRCAAPKLAPAGRYEATVAGARGYRAAGPTAEAAGGYVEGAEPDASEGRCHAALAFELSGAAQTAEATITCEPAPSR